eukprot:CAMPEP_0180117936 /NCGR_PEP_ID=MMETSP0986-20121125/1188_1 /TAXON_ID=697907 /ORGANISM="non described non described, Strain CCMP2293" /LENGTH=135 /DNA_ID=CAMNT_0022056851 /DNA_START=110 /DNA_END=518 /DNA_ORIENTATION=-
MSASPPPASDNATQMGHHNQLRPVSKPGPPWHQSAWELRAAGQKTPAASATQALRVGFPTLPGSCSTDPRTRNYGTAAAQMLHPKIHFRASPDTSAQRTVQSVMMDPDQAWSSLVLQRESKPVSCNGLLHKGTPA